jgi:hypothetical protein
MNEIKVISFVRNKQTWYYTGRHRGNNNVFTKDVNKIPESGIFRYCSAVLYPEREIDWRAGRGYDCTLSQILKLTFEDEYHAEQNVSHIKVVTLKEAPRTLKA